MAVHGRIPEDLQRQILLRVPASSAMRFRRVSPGWRNIIDEPSFVRLLLNRGSNESSFLVVDVDGRCWRRESQGMDKPEFFAILQTLERRPKQNRKRKQRAQRRHMHIPTLLVERSHEEATKNWAVAGCVEGIFMLDKRRDVYSARNLSEQLIWNPSASKTRTKVASSLPAFCHSLPCKNFGGAYDSQRGDYKFVKLFQTLEHGKDLYWRNNKGFSWIAVYSLSTNMWSTYAFEDPNWAYFDLSPRKRVDLNGVVYGAAGNQLDLERNDSHVIAIDVRMDPPVFSYAPFFALDQPNSYTILLNETRTNLILITLPWEGPQSGAIWDLQNLTDNMMEWNWTQRSAFLVTLPPANIQHHCVCIYLTKDGRLIFNTFGRITSLDLQTETEKLLLCCKRFGFTIWPYVENLNFVNQV